jgi:Uma2 family endonuclease
MASTEQITTAEQLFQAPGLGRSELVRGELIMMTPAGSEHGSIAINITVPLATHVKQQALGRVFSADTGFQIASEPDTVRSPDVAFVRADRLESPLTVYRSRSQIVVLGVADQLSGEDVVPGFSLSVAEVFA